MLYIKKSLIILFSIICVLTAGACDKPQSLAEFIDNHESVKTTLETLDSSQGFDMTVDGNTIRCEYDIANLPDMTEDAAIYKENVKTFEDNLESRCDIYSEFCKTLEEESGIEGISIVVTYAYRGTSIASKEYSSSK